MPFNVVFIICLFAITAVSGKGKANQPPASPSQTLKISPGQIVEVLSSGLMPYYQILDGKKYRPAVYVGTRQAVGAEADRPYDAYVVPVVPEDSPSSLFPAHLKQNVTEYFNHEYPKSTDEVKGDLDLAGYHGVKGEDIKIISGSTKMSEDSLKSMKRAIDKNISTKGMCPLSVKYPNLEGANPGSKEIDHRLKIKPGQVITTIHKEGPDGLGIFVCWTGQGNMALMVVLNGPSGDPREMVSASMFSESGGAKTQIPKAIKVSQLYFISYKMTKDPQPRILKKELLNEFAGKALWHMSNLEYGPMSPNFPGNHPNLIQPDIQPQGNDKGGDGGGGGKGNNRGRGRGKGSNRGRGRDGAGGGTGYRQS